MRSDRVAVIGAGVGGLVSAIALAKRGCDVVLLERAAGPGGKVRRIRVGDAAVDAGPTVLTMRSLFEEIFAEAGASLTDHLTLRPLETLARHAWDGEHRLDLFADADRTADAIGELSGPAEARRYMAFCARAKQIFDVLETPFIRSQKPGNPLALLSRVGARGWMGLSRISPYTTMSRELERLFRDERLRQLFGRYATYCGSSPYLAPATLMLVAHVEREGVWDVEGGIQRIVTALAGLGETLGVSFRYGCGVDEIVVRSGRVAAVRTSSGEVIDVDAVVVNADPGALAGGRFGREAARALPPIPKSRRSLSAMTWACLATTENFPLKRHNVFFSGDYAAEFEDILVHARLPREPTVYVCAQDRGNDSPDQLGAPERLLCIVNAPANGDTHTYSNSEVKRCEEQMISVMRKCGLRVNRTDRNTVVTTPSDFEALFPATGGAIYGQASHGWMASFQRPGTRTRIPNLFLAGGSVHPGPGMPMAALSGRLAAAALLAALGSTSRSRATATSGGMSMRSATMDVTGSR